jgi:hypothetical protein
MLVIVVLEHPPAEERRHCNRYICHFFLVSELVKVLLLPLTIYRPTIESSAPNMISVPVVPADLSSSERPLAEKSSRELPETFTLSVLQSCTLKFR